MKTYSLRLLTLCVLLGLFACGRPQQTTIQEPARLEIVLEEVIDVSEAASTTVTLPPKLMAELKDLGSYVVSSSTTISASETKRQLKIVFTLKEGEDDATELLHRVRAALPDRAFSMTVHGKKTTTTTKLSI